jgi:cytochrome c oxidase subunit II
MRYHTLARLIGKLTGWLGSALILSGCQVEAQAFRTIPSALDVRGEGARIIAEEWWIQFTLGTLVFLGVIGLLGYIMVLQKRRQADLSVDLEDVDGRFWIWGGGVVMPAIILTAVLVFQIRSMLALSAPPGNPNNMLTIEVIGHRWWWEVRYPELGIITANQIHIPAGEPVRFNVTSADIIHSFWVPQLHGKIDMNPGDTNSIWMQANEPGFFRGICAEFCGLQHARMQFIVVAEPADQFAEWMERAAQPAPEPVDEQTVRGQQVFLESPCALCHAIAGTPADARVGPDLTHLASRLTLAAGSIENTRGSLAGWIIDSQHVKPGNLMPPIDLTSEELQALLDYLETLE